MLEILTVSGMKKDQTLFLVPESFYQYALNGEADTNRNQLHVSDISVNS